MRLRSFQQNLLAALALLALVLIAFHRLAFTDWIMARGDTFSYHYPYWQIRNEAILAGRLPLWSPDLFMGVPLLANPQLGVFYPLNWLVAPLSPPDGVRVSVIGHVFWGALGAYLLARRTLRVGWISGMIGAVVFALGGHIGAHVEQINQLQGLAWLPWLLYLFDRAITVDKVSPSILPPLANTLLLAMAFALQLFSGHTQTVFMSGVALGIYALCTRPIRGVLTLAGAGIAAVVLALPQLIPTLELSSVSNRRGGFNVNQATAFSFNPFVTGRGLLPSYDRMIFSEYIAYPGIIGAALAWIGIFDRPTASPSPSESGGRRWERLRRWFARPQTRWIVLALVGLALAYGLYNPLYLALAGLPGFNLFRVPARWLALFALGVGMLAALGAEALSKGAAQRATAEGRPSRRPYGMIGGFAVVVIALMAAAPLATRTPDMTPTYPPEPITWVVWAVALVIAGVGLVIWTLDGQKSSEPSLMPNAQAPRLVVALILGAAVVELLLASNALAFNQLVPPDAFSAQEFTISQMRVYDAGQTPPGRILSLSDLQFDPGNRAELERRYDALGISGEARALAFDSVKLKTVLAANQPLLWGVPSIDGFDGGLLPTGYYTAFTSLLLPQGELRTIDGRLREILYSDACGGACVPDPRWLAMTDTRYLLTDKVYDLVRDGVFFDTTFTRSGTAYYPVSGNFAADAVEILYTCAAESCAPPPLSVLSSEPADRISLQPVTSGEALDRYQFARYELSSETVPTLVQIDAATDQTIRAVSLVHRTGDDVTFEQLTPYPRLLSSDIKLYAVSPDSSRAVLVPTASCVADDEYGTEEALNQMRLNAGDSAIAVHDLGALRGSVILSTGNCDALPQSRDYFFTEKPEITEYQPTRVTIENADGQDGYLLLKDAYYPGWIATIDGEPTPIYRANVMFRAVWVPAGVHEIVFEYRPAWLPGILIAGGAAWGLGALALLGIVVRRIMMRRWLRVTES